MTISILLTLALRWPWRIWPLKFHAVLSSKPPWHFVMSSCDKVTRKVYIPLSFRKFNLFNSIAITSPISFFTYWDEITRLFIVDMKFSQEIGDLMCIKCVFGVWWTLKWMDCFSSQCTKENELNLLQQKVATENIFESVVNSAENASYWKFPSGYIFCLL